MRFWMRAGPAVAVLGLTLAVGFPAPGAAQTEAAPVSTADELLVRFEYRGREAFGRMDGEVIRELPGDDIFTASMNVPTGRSYALENVTLLPPVDPAGVQKVLGVAMNTRRLGRSQPVPHPRWYLMLPTTLNGPGERVEMPRESRGMTYSGGLVLIVGRGGKNISVGAAPDHIWGVTVGNSFSDIGWVGERGSVGEPGRVPGHATDGWFPVGPAAARGIDLTNLSITTRLNGEVVQSGGTQDLLNGIPELVSNISRYVTLRPGDLIFTGTIPYREGARRVLQSGDELEVEIPGVGVLRNRVIPMSTQPGGRP